MDTGEHNQSTSIFDKKRSIGGIMGGIDTGMPTSVENRGNNCNEYLNHYFRQIYFSSIMEIRLQTILI